jgi:hypothetical protein
MPPILVSLDLHGYTKENALRKLTETLEMCQRQPTSSIWTTLSVITGVGVHSPAGGAVLRPAVQQYLDQRHFLYKYSSGCFDVRVDSGQLRYNIKATVPTTKLIVQQTAEVSPSPVVVAANQKKNAVAARPLSAAAAAAAAPPLSEPSPLPRDVARDDQEVDLGKLRSLEDFRAEQRIMSKEKKALERALELSALDEDDCDVPGLDDEISSEHHHNKLLEAILQKSKVDYDFEYERRLQQEELTLQQAIDMSMNESSSASSSSRGVDYYRDEEVLLQRILERSVVHTSAQQEDEEELLRLAIEASKLEMVEEQWDHLVLQSAKDG